MKDILLPLCDTPALCGDKLLDALQRRIGAITRLELFSLPLAAVIPYAVIAGDLRIAGPPDGAQGDVHDRQVDGRCQLCGAGLAGGQMTVVSQFELQDMTGRRFSLRQGTGGSEAAAGDPLGIVAKSGGRRATAPGSSCATGSSSGC